MIYITDRIRIKKFDEWNLQIEEYTPVEEKVNHRKTGKTRYEWIGKGYYGDLKSALIGVLKKQLFETAEQETTIYELCAIIAAIGNHIEEIAKKELKKC